VPQINQQFLDWLQKMVAPNFKERYPNAAAAKAALQPIDVNRSSRRRNWKLRLLHFPALA
jgi:hypothetical protein